MLHFDDAKMSKSLGNLVLVRELLERVPGDVIRHYLVSHHYRSEVQYREEDLLRSVDAVEELRRASRLADRAAGHEPALDGTGTLDPEVARRRDRFLGAMDDDLDTPHAMSELQGLARLALADLGSDRASQAGWMVRELGGRILGLRLAAVSTARPVAA
jgi:cysteinyl-tRNA synthetase